MDKESENQGRFGEYPEWTWIQENQDLLREKYEGKWIAVVGQEVVGVADNSHEAFMTFKDFTVSLLYHVPSLNEPIALGSMDLSQVKS